MLLHFLMIRPPPSSILFPYTTLFRSGLSVWGTATHLGLAVGTILGPLISAGVAIVIGLGYRAMSQETRDRQALILDLLATRDRKSTRLNSSHPSISYAVFCLKKKTTI